MQGTALSRIGVQQLLGTQVPENTRNHTRQVQKHTYPLTNLSVMAILSCQCDYIWN